MIIRYFSFLWPVMWLQTL